MTAALNLFGGIDGSGIGLRRAGYQVTSYEWDRQAVEIANRNGGRSIVADLNTWDWSTTQTPYLLWASPPCQPFSKAGKKRGREDERDCIPAWVRALQELLPPVTIMENVRDLASAKNAAYVAEVVAQVEALGYRVEWRILNSADFGLGQKRLRFILVGRRDGQPITWPAITHGPKGAKPYVTAAEELGLPDHLRDANREDIATRMAGRVYGERWNPIAHATQPWLWTHPSTTIAGRLLAPMPGATANRTNGSLKGRNDGVEITEAQALRLMGFPTTHQIPTSGTTQKQRIQWIGNAVPPVLAEVLGREALARSTPEPTPETPPAPVDRLF